MKSLILPSAILVTSLASLLNAQAPAAAEPSSAAPALTEAQVTSVLNQLRDLEADIMQKRGSNLSSVMAKLRTAMASDQTSMKFYLDCDKLVNSERKEVDKSDARKRQDNMERRSKGGDQEEGDFGFAVRLGLQYIVLTIEAHEAKDEDFKKMGPKLQEYIQNLVAAAPKLKGRAKNHLSNALSNGNPIVEAFSLNRYLKRQGWSTSPMDFGSMYMETLLPFAKEDNKEALPDLWDSRINAEGIFRKENMFAPEFELWTQNELPTLRWQRATYLYENGPSAINALADMLKLIKENPGHADAPKWVKELRQLVNQSAPAQTSPNLELPAGS